MLFLCTFVGKVLSQLVAWFILSALLHADTVVEIGLLVYENGTVIFFS